MLGAEQQNLYLVVNEKLNQNIYFKSFGFSIKGLSKKAKEKLIIKFDNISKEDIESEKSMLEPSGVAFTKENFVELLEKVIIFDSISDKLKKLYVDENPLQVAAISFINLVLFIKQEEQTSFNIKKFHHDSQGDLDFLFFVHTLFMTMKKLDESEKYYQKVNIDWKLTRRILKFSNEISGKQISRFISVIRKFPIKKNFKEGIVNCFTIMEEILVKYNKNGENTNITSQLVLKLGFASKRTRNKENYSKKIISSYNVRSGIVHGSVEKIEEGYKKYISLEYHQKDYKIAEKKFHKAFNIKSKAEENLRRDIKVFVFLTNCLRELLLFWFIDPSTIEFMKES